MHARALLMQASPAPSCGVVPPPLNKGGTTETHGDACWAPTHPATARATLPHLVALVLHGLVRAVAVAHHVARRCACHRGAGAVAACAREQQRCRRGNQRPAGRLSRGARGACAMRGPACGSCTHLGAERGLAVGTRPPAVGKGAGRRCRERGAAQGRAAAVADSHTEQAAWQQGREAGSGPVD